MSELFKKNICAQIDCDIESLKSVMKFMEEDGYVCTTEEYVIKTMIEARDKIRALTTQRDEAIREVIQLCMQRGHCKFDGGYVVCDEHKHLFDLLKEVNTNG